MNAELAPGEVGAVGVADAIPGERGPSVVARGRSLQARVQNALALGVVVLLGGGFLTWYYMGLADSHAEAKAKKPAAVASEVTLPPLGPAPVVMKPVENAPMVVEGSAEAEALLAGEADPADPALAGGPPVGYPPNVYAAPPPSDPVLQRRLDSPVLVRGTAGYSAAVDSETKADGPADLDGPGRPGVGLAGAGAGGGTELRRVVAAYRDGGDRCGRAAGSALAVAEGRVHRLHARDRDRLDASGHDELRDRDRRVERGRVGGADGARHQAGRRDAQRRGPGQKRLFVLWNEARTPMGVTVALGSPGTDALGRSGVTGEVDTHFAARFGAAILISLIDAGAAAVVAAQSDGNGSVVIAPQGASNVMSEVLRSTVNIPPTIRVAQGERVAVLVARDVSFREVYAIAKR